MWESRRQRKCTPSLSAEGMWTQNPVRVSGEQRMQVELRFVAHFRSHVRPLDHEELTLHFEILISLGIFRLQAHRNAMHRVRSAFSPSASFRRRRFRSSSCRQQSSVSTGLGKATRIVSISRTLRSLVPYLSLSRPGSSR